MLLSRSNKIPRCENRRGEEDADRDVSLAESSPLRAEPMDCKQSQCCLAGTKDCSFFHMHELLLVDLVGGGFSVVFGGREPLTVFWFSIR